MMNDLQISNIRVPVTVDVSALKLYVLKKFNLRDEQVVHFQILRSSIDARKKNDVVYDYSVRIILRENIPQLLEFKYVKPFNTPASIPYHTWKSATRPVIVGFGPSGMFAALYFARCGARPIVIERGKRVEERRQDVANFLKTRVLNPDSNVQFGEGGAGTFSDGKLSTNLHNEFIHFVLQEFYQHGATEDVLYAQNPHVGTDFLERVVREIREEILALNGEIYFQTCFLDFEKKRHNLIEVKCSNNLIFNTNHLLLCLGHSARDTIRHLFLKGLTMEAKGFSVGVRIEHLQKQVNEMQYGRYAKFLPPASYKGVVHLPNNRSVYTFCMCPGGTVMASANVPKTIVTNGMSEKKRDLRNANSALLVGLEPADFQKDSPLDGLAFQEQIERAAFEIAGNYCAPANLVREFLQGKIASAPRSIQPSYPHGVCFCNLNRCLPDFVVQSLRDAIPLMDKKLRGFNNPDAVLTGVETRSSSPIRICRDATRQSNITGIYPVGEGAGYAGGITSAAIDGLRTALDIVQNSVDDNFANETN